MTPAYPQFEAVKMALRQDKDGYILMLRIHPDDLDEDVMRDFVGSRYQVVMVRLNETDLPQDRKNFKDPLKVFGVLCRDPMFRDWIHKQNEFLFDETPTEDVAVEWLKSECSIFSRTELKDNKLAQSRLWQVEKEYKEWKEQK